MRWFNCRVSVVDSDSYDNVVEGTQAGATAYSITVTDKVNNLKTYLYVEYLLTELPEKVSKKKDSTFFWVILCRGHLKRRRLVVR